jgi:phosphoribosylformimino-5-aminoimidazole carboxamide ribotide isomerase
MAKFTPKKDFLVFPAVDIMGGKCVRLVQGDFEQSTVFNSDPVFMARRWESLGAKYLHVIDLDGAKKGSSVNFEVIRSIARCVNIPIQVGGGIRDYDTAKIVLDAGAHRIIIGSSILKDPEFAKKALEKFSEQLIVGMDCRRGKLSVSAWTEDTEISAIEKAIELKEYGLKNVIYTDIERDGMLVGPNVEESKHFATETGINTIVSGGVSNIDDIYKVKSVHKLGLPVEGVVVGKALYVNKIRPRDLFNLKDN